MLDELDELVPLTPRSKRESRRASMSECKVKVVPHSPAALHPSVVTVSAWRRRGHCFHIMHCVFGGDPAPLPAKRCRQAGRAPHPST